MREEAGLTPKSARTKEAAMHARAASWTAGVVVF